MHRSCFRKQIWLPLWKGRERICCFFKQGDEVTVYYDPIDPQDSYVLEDRAGNLVGPLFAAFGALGIILAVVFKISGTI